MTDMLCAVNTIKKNIKVIDLKFMESAGSYLEIDDNMILARIERPQTHKKKLQYAKIGFTNFCCKRLKYQAGHIK